jgi:WD40 repeat protein
MFRSTTNNPTTQQQQQQQKPSLILQDAFTTTSEPRALGTYNSRVWSITGTGKHFGIQIDSFPQNRFHQLLSTSSNVVAIAWAPSDPNYTTAKEWRFAQIRSFTQTSGVFVVATAFSLESFIPDPTTQKWKPFWIISTANTVPTSSSSSLSNIPFEISSLAVSPGASHVLCGGPSGLRMWNVEEKIAIWSLQGDARPPGEFNDSKLLAFSSDGRLIATCATQSEMVRVWWHTESGETGLMAFRLLAHHSPVTYIEFNPRMGAIQQSLLTITKNGMIQIWHETSREDDFDFYLIMALDVGELSFASWIRYGIEYQGLLWPPNPTVTVAGITSGGNNMISNNTTTAPPSPGLNLTSTTSTTTTTTIRPPFPPPLPPPPPSSSSSSANTTTTTLIQQSIPKPPPPMISSSSNKRATRRWGAMMNGHGHVMTDDEMFDSIEFRVGSYTPVDTVRDWLVVISPANARYQVWVIESLGKRREKRCEVYREWLLENKVVNRLKLQHQQCSTSILALTRVVLPPAIDLTSISHHPNSLWADNPPSPHLGEVHVGVDGTVISLLFDRGSTISAVPSFPLISLSSSVGGKTLLSLNGNGQVVVYDDFDSLHAGSFETRVFQSSAGFNLLHDLLTKSGFGNTTTNNNNKITLLDSILVNRDLACFLVVVEDSRTTTAEQEQQQQHNHHHLIYYRRNIVMESSKLTSALSQSFDIGYYHKQHHQIVEDEFVYECNFKVNCQDVGLPMSLVLFLGRIVILCEQGLALCELPQDPSSTNNTIAKDEIVSSPDIQLIWICGGLFPPPLPPQSSSPTSPPLSPGNNNNTISTTKNSTSSKVDDETDQSTTPPQSTVPTSTTPSRLMDEKISCAVVKPYDGSLLIATHSGSLLTFSSSNLSTIDGAIIRHAFDGLRPIRLISSSTLPSLVLGVCTTNKLVAYASGGVTINGKKLLESLSYVSDASFYEFAASGYELLAVAFASPSVITTTTDQQLPTTTRQFPTTTTTNNNIQTSSPPPFYGIRIYQLQSQTGSFIPLAESSFEPCIRLAWMSNGRLSAITADSGRLILFVGEIGSNSSNKSILTIAGASSSSSSSSSSRNMNKQFLDQGDATTTTSTTSSTKSNNAVVIQLEALGRLTWTGDASLSPLALPDHHPTCILENLRLGNVQEAGFALNHILSNINKQSRESIELMGSNTGGGIVFIPFMIPGEEQQSFRARMQKERSQSVMVEDSGSFGTSDSSTSPQQQQNTTTTSSGGGGSPKSSLLSPRSVSRTITSTLKDAETQLSSVTIAGLNSVERLKLLVALDSFRTVSTAASTSTISSLDTGASRFLLSIRLFRVAQKTLPPRDRPTCLKSCDVAWAVHSDAELTKLAFTDFSGGVTWADARALGMGLWLKSSKEVCRVMAETMARTQYSHTKDPFKCLLFYAAVGKAKAAGGLFKLAQQVKIAELLMNDFSTERYQTVAIKNAYAALSKQKFEEAAAFFLLGNKVSDAVRLCIRNLEDYQLAIFLCRLVDTPEAKECLTDILTNTVLILATSCHDPWLASIAWTLLGKPEEALACFFAPDFAEEEASPTIINSNTSSNLGNSHHVVNNNNKNSTENSAFLHRSSTPLLRTATPSSVLHQQQFVLHTPEHQKEWFQRLSLNIQPTITRGFDPSETSFIKFLASRPEFQWGEGKNFLTHFDLSLSDNRAAQYFLRAGLPILCLQFATDDKTRLTAAIRAGIPYALSSSSASWLETCFRGLSEKCKIDYSDLLEGVEKACSDLNFPRGELACAELRGDVDLHLGHFVDTFISFFETSSQDEWSRSPCHFLTWALLFSESVDRYSTQKDSIKENLSLIAYVALTIGALLSNEYAVIEVMLNHQGIRKGYSFHPTVREEAERLALWLCQSPDSDSMGSVGFVASNRNSSNNSNGGSYSSMINQLPRVSSAGSEEFPTNSSSQPGGGGAGASSDFPLPPSTPPPPTEVVGSTTTTSSHAPPRVPQKSPSHPGLTSVSAALPPVVKLMTWSTADKEIAERWADGFAHFVLRYLLCEYLVDEFARMGTRERLLEGLVNLEKRFLKDLHTSAPRPSPHLPLQLLTDVLRRFMTSKRAFSDLSKQLLWIKCKGPERIQQFALELAFAFRGWSISLLSSNSLGSGDIIGPSSLGSAPVSDSDGTTTTTMPSPSMERGTTGGYFYQQQSTTSMNSSSDQKKALPVTLYQRVGHGVNAVCLCNALPDYMILASDAGIRDVNIDSALRHRERTPDGRGLLDPESSDWNSAFTRFRDYENITSIGPRGSVDFSGDNHPIITTGTTAAGSGGGGAMTGSRTSSSFIAGIVRSGGSSVFLSSHTVTTATTATTAGNMRSNSPYPALPSSSTNNNKSSSSQPVSTNVATAQTMGLPVGIGNGGGINHWESFINGPAAFGGGSTNNNTTTTANNNNNSSNSRYSQAILSNHNKSRFFNMGQERLRAHIHNGTKLSEKIVHDNVSAVRLSSHPFLPNYLSGESDGTVLLWSVGEPRAVAKFARPSQSSWKSTSQVMRLRVSPDGTRIACGDASGCLIFWHLGVSADSIVPYAGFSCHAKPVMDTVFMNAGSFIASGSLDSTICFWDTILPPRACKVAFTPLPHIGNVNDTQPGIHSMVYVPYENALLVGAGNHLFSYDLRMNRFLSEVRDAHTKPITTIEANPARQSQIATASADGSVKMWSVYGGQIVQIASFTGLHKPVTSHSSSSSSSGSSSSISVMYGGVTGLAFSRNGAIVTSGADGTVKAVMPRD